MRKHITIVLSLLLIAMLAAPAAAVTPGFVLKVNDQAYAGEFSVENGTTMIPLEFIAKTLDAQTTIENDQIKIVRDNFSMLLTSGSNEAVFNGRTEPMPLAPYKGNNDYMVPLRYVLASFGTKVSWDASTYEIKVYTPSEVSDAEAVMTKITEAMVAQNSYKMKTDMTMKMDMTMDEQTQHMTMSGDIDASVQEKPMLIHMTTTMRIDEISGTEEIPAEEIPEELLSSEMVMNEEGFFMTMPGQEGWVKVEMEGLDIGQLMEQYGSQDPIQSVMQMKDSGAVITFAPDKIIDGKAYGVIHIEMGQDAMAKYLDDMLGQTGNILGLPLGGEETAEFEAMLQEILSSMEFDMIYDMVFDKETYLPITMELESDVEMTMNIPGNEELEVPDSVMQMKMNQKALYQLYDYGVAFEVPVISQYKTMSEMMEEMMAELPPVPEETLEGPTTDQ